jgi:acyl-CoA thioesterase FadM
MYDTRFSDFGENGELRINACLSYFESARFDITRKTGFIEKLKKMLAADDVILPVIEVKLTQKEPVLLTESVKIVTYLKQVKIPMFIFQHVLMDEENKKEYVSAELKVAIVIPEHGTVRAFDSRALLKINETIQAQGEVTTNPMFEKI